MTVNATMLTNLGLMEAAGGSLVITTAVANAGGTIEDTASQVFLQGASIAGGVLVTTGGGNIGDNSMRDAADQGAAILVVSSDFEEVATLCDRALVISRGRIAGALHGAGLTVDNVLARASLGAGHVAV
jgi:hypothetical protein